jgi:hypothetical protein
LRKKYAKNEIIIKFGLKGGVRNNSAFSLISKIALCEAAIFLEVLGIKKIIVMRSISGKIRSPV